MTVKWLMNVLQAAEAVLPGGQPLAGLPIFNVVPKIFPFGIQLRNQPDLLLSITSLNSFFLQDGFFNRWEKHVVYQYAAIVSRGKRFRVIFLFMLLGSCLDVGSNPGV